MQQHEVDPWSLVFGVAFLFVSAGYLLAHTTDVTLHWLLVVPAALIVLGVAIFAVVVSRMRRSDGEVDVDDHGGVV